MTFLAFVHLAFLSFWLNFISMHRVTVCKEPGIWASKQHVGKQARKRDALWVYV